MLAGHLAVHPDGGGVKHSFELQADCGVLPFEKRFERTTVPANSAILGVGRIDLPGMRDRDVPPLRR